MAMGYARYHKLRERSWKDNALLHHSAHLIDLLHDWCGGVEPKGCVALPDIRLPQNVSLLGKLPSGGAVTIGSIDRHETVEVRETLHVLVSPLCKSAL